MNKLAAGGYSYAPGLLLLAAAVLMVVIVPFACTPQPYAV